MCMHWIKDVPLCGCVALCTHACWHTCVLKFQGMHWNPNSCVLYRIPGFMKGKGGFEIIFLSWNPVFGTRHIIQVSSVLERNPQGVHTTTHTHTYAGIKQDVGWDNMCIDYFHHHNCIWVMIWAHIDNTHNHAHVATRKHVYVYLYCHKICVVLLAVIWTVSERIHGTMSSE